jgi:hypothetical protein
MSSFSMLWRFSVRGPDAFGEVRSGLKARPHRSEEYLRYRGLRIFRRYFGVHECFPAKRRTGKASAHFVKPADLLSRLLGISFHKVLDQHWNVFLALPQRRQINRENIQAVEEVGAKCPRRNSGRKSRLVILTLIRIYLDKKNPFIRIYHPIL